VPGTPIRLIGAMRLPSRPRPTGPAPERTPISVLLSRLLERPGERIRLGEVADEVGGRGLGLVLLVLAIPETIPMIGTSLVLAIPIGMVGAYMLKHGEAVMLPGRIRNWSVKRTLLDSAIRRTLPLLRWAERKARPRLRRLSYACRAQGAVCLLMAVILAIPIPGLNLLAAFAVFGTGLGMLLHDGRIIALAFASAAVATLGMAAILIGAITLAT
jgi:hypothetical protein